MNTYELERAYPPLTDAFEALRQLIERLSPSAQRTKVIGPSGIRATARLARELLQADRFVEASCLIRETLVNVWAQEAGASLQPGEEGFDKERRDIERRMKKYAYDLHDAEQGRVRRSERRPKPPPGDVAGLAARFNGEFGDSRNDAAHCGYREVACDREAITEGLAVALDRLDRLVERLAD